ncbi:hypothetical protein P20439_3581 [Pseudoalteromonas sp. BSi20439]|nr:hypothetical protein P20439_3581 [Pseudoalteromonas sp. BSi20439]
MKYFTYLAMSVMIIAVTLLFLLKNQWPALAKYLCYLQ